MTTPSLTNPRRRFAFPRLFLAAVLMLAGAIMAVFAAAPPAEDPVAAPQPSKAANSNDIYIVQLRADPVATYRGEVRGLRATAPAPGRKINQNSAEVVRYADHLRAQHDSVLSRVGGDKVYSYVYALNGFAAKMTAKQAEAMRADPDVLSVEKDEAMKMDTSTTTRFLGLSAPGGLWDQLGGGSNTSNGPGENMVVGIVDSGAWPEHPSFSNRDAQGNVVYGPVSGFTGTCQASSTDGSWNAAFCNNKIVSAQKYNAGHGGDAGLIAKYPWEFLSPRDYSGHGSHTASTTAGNHGILPNNNLAFLGRISGMAPRARIAVYKVCWETKNPAAGGCFSSDSAAAIDQATADGVDGINFSISGSTTSFTDAVQTAFRNAAQAGIFVATSAGNDGPAVSTVGKPAPWAINVANGTHDRNTEATLTLGNGQTFQGVSTAPNGVGPAPLIRSQDAAASTAPSADSVALCFSKTWNNGPASLDPAKVSGKIVVCERGVNDRVDKSKAVQEAGGIGMVLVNTSANTLNADFHSVPTVHLNEIQRTAVQAYAQTAGATASIGQAVVTTQAAPFTASTSSRGPSLAAGGDILKPDVMAPGSDVLAAVAPPNNSDQLFALYSGTSMASPHVLGVGMLLKQQHPAWSPMMIQSALMTTGVNNLDTGITEATRIFRQGAGQIVPNNATNPGLVFDSNINDWVAFLCGATTAVPQATCNTLVSSGYSTNPSDLNRASIAIGDLVGAETVKRTVTNVDTTAATYTASVTNPPGLNITVNPASITLNPGQSASVNITITRTNAAFNNYTGGYVTWTGGGHTVRIPVVARPVIMTVAAAATSNGSAINLPIRFGYEGTFTATPRGMVPAAQNQGTVTDDPNDNFTPGGPGTTSFDVVVPTGTTYARFALFDANTDKPGLHDLDIYVYRVSTNTQVASTGGATSNEEANLVNPPADTYRVWVHGYNTSGPSANFTLFSWVLGNTAARNMFVLSPWSATNGASANMNVRFANLAPNTKYLGSIAYSGTTGLPTPTIVRVDTGATPPTATQLVEVASIRSHGALGNRELVFPAGTRGVESRRGANYNGVTRTGDYTVVFRFSAPISQASAQKTSGSGTIMGKTQNGTDLVLNLSGVENAQTLSFNLTDVVDAEGNSVPAEQADIRFLVGDATGDLVVNSGDVMMVRNNSGNTADGAAIASDINCDGVVNSGDVTAVKNASGTGF